MFPVHRRQNRIVLVCADPMWQVNCALFCLGLEAQAWERASPTRGVLRGKTDSPSTNTPSCFPLPYHHSNSPYQKKNQNKAKEKRGSKLGLLTGTTRDELHQSSPCQLRHTLLWGPCQADNTAESNATVGHCNWQFPRTPGLVCHVGRDRQPTSSAAFKMHFIYIPLAAIRTWEMRIANTGTETAITQVIVHSKFKHLHHR